LRGRQNDRRVARQGAVLANFGRWAAREPRARRDDHPREPELSLPELILPARGGLSHLTPSERQAAPSPLVGEGWGGGHLSVSAEPSPPSRFARSAREPTSPTRGGVTGERRQPYALALPVRGGWLPAIASHRVGIPLCSKN